MMKFTRNTPSLYTIFLATMLLMSSTAQADSTLLSSSTANPKLVGCTFTSDSGSVDFSLGKWFRGEADRNTQYYEFEPSDDGSECNCKETQSKLTDEPSKCTDHTLSLDASNNQVSYDGSGDYLYMQTSNGITIYYMQDVEQDNISNHAWIRADSIVNYSVTATGSSVAKAPIANGYYPPQGTINPALQAYDMKPAVIDNINDKGTSLTLMFFNADSDSIKFQSISASCSVNWPAKPPIYGHTCYNNAKSMPATGVSAFSVDDNSYLAVDKDQADFTGCYAFCLDVTYNGNPFRIDPTIVNKGSSSGT